MVNAIIERGLNLLPSGGEVYYIPGVFSRDESNEYFNELFSDVRWKQEPVKIFGREMMQPRLTAWHGDTDKPYTYSGLTMEAAAWIQPLMRMKKVADEYSGVVSTSALLNLYRDGNDGLGWHRDNEKMLGPTPVIASISLGAERIFKLRRYDDKKEVIAIVLDPGSLLIMKGKSQQCWEHCVPKSKSVSGARINVTFRQLTPSGVQRPSY